ncbi:SBBP repeat-containing protein [Chitinophagaceae bacterium LB-8]|uniref:SBBP repeat-containing protein n=1 Tax=Paraflavisolibacter caeni TaxID=2982496 RepID=A0A9X2XMQ2_9BACT|nr:SBBP repeat-containing protein [Paraflavisolibacter caeni]MCU7547543.1 SBBP repeat-containing protein [Paraflavisolibacter caeni]
MEKNQLFKKALLLLFHCLLTMLSFTQVTEQWVRRYNSLENEFDYTYDLAVDASGNVYVTGLVSEETASDYTTIKYDAAGNELWVRRFNGPGNEFDQATSIAVDAKGNVYVTGFSVGGGGSWDYATIKYDAAGNELWVRWYDGPGNHSDIAASLAVDAQGNVYVTGYSDDLETNSDYATVKYDTNGNELWVRRYNGPGNNSDIAIALALDASGNVYVTGASISSATGFNYDYATVKYDANGNEKWIKMYNGSGNDIDFPGSIAVDGSGNVYVTGGSLGSTGVNDYATVKYDTNGKEKWVRRHKGGSAYSLAVDALNNVFVTGTIDGGGTGDDYGTIKYDTNGNEKWVRSYNGPGNNSDIATSLFVDASGNVYVTGTSYGSESFSDIATIKYDTNGNEKWVQRYNGPGNSFDVGVSIVVGANENVYVVGYDFGIDSQTDYVTIKYTQGSVTDINCGKKGDKVLVCHKGKTLCISHSAVAAHLKHGDQLGSCNASPSLNSITENTDALQWMEESPKRFWVSVAPNPFNSLTKIQYELPFDGDVSIKVYDVLGREVTTVVKAKHNAGLYSTELNAITLTKGIYYYRCTLTTKNKVWVQSGKFIVLK